MTAASIRPGTWHWHRPDGPAAVRPTLPASAQLQHGAGFRRSYSGHPRSRRPSRIYLFDDSFSALDYATDAALRAALADETADATVVIVAQRVATIRRADRIIVLEAGRIVAAGTHDELMQTDATYREIVLSQLTEQEAAA